MSIDFRTKESMDTGWYYSGKGSRKVTCIKCQREGSLMIKPRKIKGKSYDYYHVKHRTGKKWCYLGKYEKLPLNYKKVLERSQKIPASSKNHTPPNSL